MASIQSFAANILVYKTLRLLSSNYDKWSYFKDGIIDKEGNIINKGSASAYLRFILNIKKLISFHPLGRLKLSSLPIALSLIKESNADFQINEILLEEQLKEYGFIADD